MFEGDKEKYKKFLKNLENDMYPVFWTPLKI